MATSAELTQIESSITGVVRPVLTAVGMANPITASALLGVSMLFRFLRVGAEIRREIAAAGAALDATVRAQGIFRVPVGVDTSLSDALEFFVRDLTFPLRFRILAEQFAPEIALLKKPADPAFPEALATLKVVMNVLPDAVADRKFDRSPLLDDLFGKWLDPAIPAPDYRGMVAEMRQFIGDGHLSLRSLADQSGDFLRMKLQAAGAVIDTATQAKLTEANAKVKALLLSAFLDPGTGAVKEAVKFAVDRRAEFIQADLDGLTARRTVLEAKPAGERSDAEKAELARLVKRIPELTAFQAKVRSSAG